MLRTHGILAWIKNAVIAILLPKQTRVKRSVALTTDQFYIDLNKKLDVFWFN
jgi:hypothetical protein